MRHIEIKGGQENTKSTDEKRPSLDFVPIVVFGSPDPDALGSAYALHTLLHWQLPRKRPKRAGRH